MTIDPVEWVADRVEPRTLAFAGVALLVIGALAGLLYGVKPAWVEHQKLTAKRDRVEMAGEQDAVDSSRRLETIQEEIEQFRDQLYGSAAGIPTSEIESFVVDSLDRISHRHGVSLLGITPGAAGSIWMFDELPYEVKVEGAFFSVHEWLYDVEEALRPMVVKHFDITPNRRRTGVVLDLRVVAYRAIDGGGEG